MHGLDGHGSRDDILWSGREFACLEFFFCGEESTEGAARRSHMEAKRDHVPLLACGNNFVAEFWCDAAAPSISSPFRNVLATAVTGVGFVFVCDSHDAALTREGGSWSCDSPFLEP
jgi:hypothetical protein